VIFAKSFNIPDFDACFQELSGAIFSDISSGDHSFSIDL